MSRTVIATPLGAVGADGTVTIGGGQGFRGVVDEFGVYAYDASGRPSADPDLYTRAQAGTYGSRLVFAGSFDGRSLPGTFSVEGRGQLTGGQLDLGPGASLVLPAVRPGSPVVVTAALSAGSGRDGVVVAQWQGASQAAASAPLSATGGELSFQLSSDRRSLTATTADGAQTVPLAPPPSSAAPLVLKISDPGDARSDLLVESVLAVTSK